MRRLIRGTPAAHHVLVAERGRRELGAPLIPRCWCDADHHGPRRGGKISRDSLYYIIANREDFDAARRRCVQAASGRACSSGWRISCCTPSSRWRRSHCITACGARPRGDFASRRRG